MGWWCEGEGGWVLSSREVGGKSVRASKRAIPPVFFRKPRVGHPARLLLPGYLLDDEAVGAVADVFFANDCYAFSGERHQLRVHGRGRRFVIDGEKDCAVVAQNDQR